LQTIITTTTEATTTDLTTDLKTINSMTDSTIMTTEEPTRRHVDAAEQEVEVAAVDVDEDEVEREEQEAADRATTTRVDIVSPETISITILHREEADEDWRLTMHTKTASKLVLKQRVK